MLGGTWLVTQAGAPTAPPAWIARAKRGREAFAALAVGRYNDCVVMDLVLAEIDERIGMPRGD